ncbi:MAG: nucleoside kinase [Bacilli bacterium]|nr:nucleoside kinase [Bacilli bacterium]
MAFKVLFNNQEKVYEQPVSVLDIVGKDKEIICANVNHRVRELTYMIDKDSEIVPLTCKDRDAMRIYESSLRFLVAMAMHNIHPHYQIRFAYNVSRSIFLQILNQGTSASGIMIKELIAEMNRLVDQDIPLVRQIVSKEEAARIFTEDGYQDKVDILRYRPEKTAHIYHCGNYRNYMYSRMVPSTGYIKKWIVRYYHPGVIIQYPRPEANGEIPPFEDAPTFGKTLKRAHQWGLATGCDTIVGINERIEKDGDVEFITLCEQKHNRQLCELGQMIEDEKESIRLICIAGPSSSGKTTFANRLRIELLSRGIKPLRISLDDYYLDRGQTPLDEDGKPDFESIDALDVALFNQNLCDLIAGLEVELPKYDFMQGKRVKGRTLTVPQDQPIIIEGIHALNEKLTSSIPAHQKFKIFIAPQSQVNIDNHNPMSLTDLRLLRRIVRDHQFRNSSALSTLEMWPSVRKGEFKWIYDTQEGANYVFNSFSAYELSVMKKYAMPLLEEIETESEHFPVAERLIRMLKFFDDLPDTWIPCNAIIREFIGGSCYQDD